MGHWWTLFSCLPSPTPQAFGTALAKGTCGSRLWMREAKALTATSSLMRQVEAWFLHRFANSSGLKLIEDTWACDWSKMLKGYYDITCLEHPNFQSKSHIFCRLKRHQLREKFLCDDLKLVEDRISTCLKHVLMNSWSIWSISTGCRVEDVEGLAMVGIS